MKKSRVICQYEQLEAELNNQRPALKRAIADIAEKNIKETKIDNASFYTNKESIRENVEKLKYALRESEMIKKLEENNITKNDVFLFSKVSEDITYDLQLSILEGTYTALTAIDAITKGAEGEETFTQNRREKIDEFCLFVDSDDIIRLRDKNAIVNDLFTADLEYHEQYLGLSVTDPSKIDEIKSNLIKLYKDSIKNIEFLAEYEYYLDDNDIPFKHLWNITYQRCKKLSTVFNKYGIKNYIIAKSVQNAVDSNKEINHDVVYNKKHMIKETIPASVKQKYSIKETLQTFLLIFAIAIVALCLPCMDGIEELLQNSEILNPYADMILCIIYPLMLINLIAAIVLRAITNTQKMREESKETELCSTLWDKFDKKYYGMISDLSEEYYMLCKKDYFDSSENLIAEMLQLKNLLNAEALNCRQLLAERFNNYLPEGLLENKQLLELIIKFMKEGRARCYKEARNLAKNIIQQ